MGVVPLVEVPVLPGVGVGLLFTAPQATSVGIRRSNTRRLIPINMRLGEDEAVCIMVYPLISQGIYRKDIV